MNVQTEQQHQSKGLLQSFYAMPMAKRMAIVAFAAVIILLAAVSAQAATTGTEFTALYNFVYGAATGYLGRSISIIGGIAGLAWGAGSGKPMIAALGIVLALFGALGPTIINAIFGAGALIQ